MIEERDISVTMRDGTRLAVDVYRPEAPGRYPVLYASALHNKDIQGPDIADILPPQPAHAPLWFGLIEAGDTRRFVANGNGVAIRRLHQLTITALLDSEVVLVDAPPGRSVFNPKGS